jgi:predicted RNA-binding Zn ribbon-like protein
MLWLELANSDWTDHLGQRTAPDRLDDPKWLAEFVSRAGLPGNDSSSARVRAELRRLRRLLQRIATNWLAGHSVANRDLSALNKYLAGQRVRPRLVRADRTFHLELCPVGKGPGAAGFAVAASLADFLVKGDVHRLRACANPTCRWLFIDKTRSRTARWCGPTCGTLIKVRTLRRRRKGGQN